MKNKAYTLIELLSVIVILAIISAIAIPRVIETIGVSRITAYNVAKRNILESAKLKYLADVNDSKIIEYTVDDLITDGYLKKDIKNPITNEEYKDTKVLITNEKGQINYQYIEGNTLYDVITKLDSKDGIYKNDNDYIYKGINVNNYIYFNKEIYRILKIDLYRNIYIIKDELKENVSKNDIENYITSYFNDNYLEKEKQNIIDIDVLDYNDYTNSFNNNESYIVNNNDIWVKYNNEYKVLSNLTNKITNKNNGGNRFVLKISGSMILKEGNGSQLKPFIIEK